MKKEKVRFYVEKQSEGHKWNDGEKEGDIFFACLCVDFFNLLCYNKVSM